MKLTRLTEYLKYCIFFTMKKTSFESKIKIFSALVSFFAAFSLLSCGTVKEAAVPPAEIPAETEKPAGPEIAVEEPCPVVVEEPVPEEVAEEPAVEEVPVAEDEYARSVGNVSVSRDTFAEDKERVLKIISELDTVMKDFDYKSWLRYVDKETIDYWSRPVNLKKAQNRLPVRGLRLNSLEDYFKYVFVPARKGREVTEIRYISDKYIKAIQTGSEQDIVYYYFNKINGFWMVNIPPIDE